MRTIGRTLGVLLAGTVILLAGVVPAAHAAVDQVCVLNEVIVYSPPLTNTPQTVTFTVNGQLFNCTSGSASTGSYSETGTASNATCTSVLGAGSGTRIFHWTNTAIAPSTFSYNRTVSRIGGNIVVVAEGSIISGAFTPDPAKSMGLGVQPNPVACMTTGVPQLTAVGTLTIGI
jgi:hypothetical protein